MQTNLLSHSLAVEFPELADVIHDLKMNNAHYIKIAKEHDEVDHQITKAEEGLNALDDHTLKGLKIQRLSLKQELHKMALHQKENR